MKPFPSSMILAVLISLIFIKAGFAEPYLHAPTGIVFPDQIATLKKQDSFKDFEKDRPGLGVSVGYNGPGITVTIYAYTMGLNEIPPDLDSNIFKAVYLHARREIEMAGELGSYSNVKQLRDDQTAWDSQENGVRSLHASYSLTQNGVDRLSHLYLTEHKNHFLKIRFTYDLDNQEKNERVQKDFLKTFSEILSKNT